MWLHRRIKAHIHTHLLPECQRVWPRCDSDVMPLRIWMTYSMPVWHLFLLFSLSFPFCLAHIHRWKRKSVYLIVQLFFGWGVGWPDALWVCVVLIYANVCVGNSLGATVSNTQDRQSQPPVLHPFLLCHLIRTHPLGARGAEVWDDKTRQIITVRPPFVLWIFVDDATALHYGIQHCFGLCSTEERQKGLEPHACSFHFILFLFFV